MRHLDMRILAIDFGERRIGLAISDPEGRLAIPLATVRRTSDRAVIEDIRRIVEERDVDALVLGEPLTLDGERGAAAERVRRFGERLRRLSGLTVTYVDEALTSNEARERLRGAGIDPGRHRDRIDAVAAQILLEEYLRNRQETTPA